MITPLITDALQDMQNGDFITALLRPFTQVFASSYDVTGGFIFAILFGIMFGGIMLKTQNAVMPAITFILIAPIVMFTLPPSATPVFYAFLTLGILGSFYRVYAKRG